MLQRFPGPLHRRIAGVGGLIQTKDKANTRARKDNTLRDMEPRSVRIQVSSNVVKGCEPEMGEKEATKATLGDIYGYIDIIKKITNQAGKYRPYGRASNVL